MAWCVSGIKSASTCITMKIVSLFPLIILAGIGSLQAQTGLASRDSRPSDPGYQGIGCQLGGDEEQNGESLSSPLMMFGEIGKKPGLLPALKNNEERNHHDNINSSNLVNEVEGSRELHAQDASNVDASIISAKGSLEQNSSELNKAITSFSSQNLEEMSVLREAIKQRHEDFLFQEAFSHQHAQLQAQENVAFFLQQLQEIQRSIGEEEEPLWVSSEEEARRNQVRAFRKSLQDIEPLLKQRQLLYQQLSDAYAKKIKNGSENEGARNILSLFEEDNIFENDQRLIGAKHGAICFVEQNSQERTKQDYQEGRILVEIGIMKNFGIDALQRFRETFHADAIYKKPLFVGEVKKFIDRENKCVCKFHPDAQSYFYSSIDSLNKLQKLSVAEHSRLIRSNDHRSHFNPFSREEPSLDYITDPEQTALEGIVAVRAGLRNEDFFKNTTLIHQRDILDRFDKKFLGENKIPLTIEACNAFVQAERIRSQGWWERLRCSKPHEFNQELWS